MFRREESQGVGFVATPITSEQALANRRNIPGKAIAVEIVDSGLTRLCNG